MNVACRVFGVSSAGYTTRLADQPTLGAGDPSRMADRPDPPGPHRLAPASGARRGHAALTIGHGISVGYHQVGLLMRRADLAGLTGKPRFRQVPPQPVAGRCGDLVDRDFTRDRPHALWVTDLAEYPTRAGKIYCAVVLDTFSRRVVGWSIDSSPTAAFVTNALGMAIEGRRPDETVIRSDQNGGSPLRPSPTGPPVPTGPVAGFDRRLV